ncbi:putative regulatory protein [Escherichia coli]|uniref:Putative regulatory protein n=1 Tax=Escherichia coli TaxID=562 RepID=A0A376NVD1_ECOLX|nr:putative regulatory protein [Escherichia coli]
MVNLPVDVMPWPATLASWTIFTHDMGHYRHWLPASGEKMRKAPILFHYTNLAEGVTEQRLETDVYVPLA